MEGVVTTQDNRGGHTKPEHHADSASPSQDKDVDRISHLILDIFFENALNKFDDSVDRLAKGSEAFLSVISEYVAAGTRVEACLPAFPFKSANKVYKVLGKLPDKAEELALGRLNSMCQRVAKIYAPGARVTIISDGITYNDLLSISDQDTWGYGEALRKMAVHKHFDHIAFSRIKDLIEISLPESLREITYVANCTTFRRLLLNQHGKDDLDIDHEIAINPDTKLTYLGYKRFLESDLKYIFPRGKDRTANGYRRDCKYLAKQMLIRGDAFARAVKEAFPKYLRLSIHDSIAGNKLSISLLNTKTGFTTPWHCSVAQLADGEWISAPMGEFLKDNRLEIVEEDGRPSYFREKSQKEDTTAITEETAGYLRAARPLSTSAYLSSLSSPFVTPSPSLMSPATSYFDRLSIASPPLTGNDSAASTAATQSAFSVSSNSPKLTINDDGPLSLSGLEEPQETSGSYGRRLIPQIMDTLAASQPDLVVFSLMELTSSKPKFRRITARSFTQAVDKTAWWLRDQIGTPETIRPVGYIGPHDLRHVLLTYACVKAGYAALFLSPKNSTEGALAVLEATNCNVWVNACDGPSVPLVKEFLEQRPMNVLQLPVLEELLDASSVDPFPYLKTFKEASNDPFCYLHTSGTTGVPKPIPWSHGLIGTMDAVRLLPPVEGDNGLLPWTSDWKPGDTIYSSFPMSHGAGIIMDILMPALFNLHCVLGPSGILPNINLVETLAENIPIDIWSMVPSLVDEVGETPEVLAKLKSSKFICASGGPVSPVSAGKANEVIRVLNLTGTTEGLFIGNLVPPREDWHWFSFHPYSGFEFKEIEQDTYEHWVHRNDHHSLFQGIFHTFSEKSSINFKDLYVKHPSKPYLWAFKGRSDDLVVLSNSYKISPLETEAFITTHPAISGCLIFGTAKPQAGLLIELKDPKKKTEKLLNSIWETIQRANSASRHKNQLMRDFVTFAEPDKPFIRTDKGTIKRPATLALYADYIDRFYGSRGEGSLDTTTIDTSSIGSIQVGVRSMLSNSLSGINDASLDTNLFDLGLDSLSIFAAIKTIRSATGLGEQIAPRHVYANPTIAAIASIIMSLLVTAEPRTPDKASDIANASDSNANIRSMIAQHRARQSFKLNAFDYVNPNHGMGLVFYLPLREGTSFEAVFNNLQEGLNRTFDLIPALSGKMMNCSEQEIGYTPGDLCVTIPPLSMASKAHNRLLYNDLSSILPPFEELRRSGFVPSAFSDSLVLRDDPFPAMPADIFVGQANFITGGCLLAIDMNHCCLDGLGVMVALKAWAENCRYLQGDESATCEWYDSESFNHSLPDIIHEQEGWARPLEEMDLGTWGYLPFFPNDVEDKSSSIGKSPTATPSKALPPRLEFPLHSVWPLPRAERCLKTTLFLIPPEKLEQMKYDVMADPEAKGVINSISDIVQAFFWCAAIRSRYRLASDVGKQSFSPDDLSILEMPIDGRPYFSSQLPSTYMGSMLIMNRSSMPVNELCSPETSIGRVAYLLRQSAQLITPSLVHDAFTILQSLTDHSRFSTANMGLDHMNAMISNMMLFPTSDINFGDKLFGNGGSPESMRPQLERGNGRFRFLVIFPMKKDGGVELVLGTHPDELEMLQADEEFMRYAELVDSNH